MLVLAGLISTIPAGAGSQEKPKVKIPEPGVPEIMTLEGRFVRAAYNNEGYVILGYRLANESVGGEWMLLEVGITVRDDVPDYTLKRDALSLETPDGKTIPLPTVEEYREMLARTREEIPGAAVTSDFIVGFCGETDADFEQTRELVRQSRFKNSFIFKYSERPGTKGAELFADDVGLRGADVLVGGIGAVDPIAVLDPLAQPAEDVGIAEAERVGGRARKIEDTRGAKVCH